MRAKRFFDFCASLAALILLSPAMAIIGICVWLFVGRPILFLQTRPGIHGRPFRICKFRTMTDACESDGSLLPDRLRLTPFGRLLRSTSLDELPALWNVLTGDMSLVGPRPLLMEYLPLYSPEQERRHNVRPGMSGWAQIKGRNSLSWEEKFALDVWYVDHRSFWLDLYILWRTLIKVFRREGISHGDHATMSKFTGNST